MANGQILINTVGTAAGICSIASFVPQIIKIYQDKDASGVSLRMFAVTATAFILWTIYGVLLQSWPVAASNAICMTLASVILILRWRYGKGGAARNSAA